MSDILSSTTPLSGDGGVVFEYGPYSNADFAVLLIQAYKANYQIRLPNFEPFMQENIPSIVSWQANSTPEGQVIDIPAQETDGSNVESDLAQLVADHSESTTAGLMVQPTLNPFEVTLVPGVVDILSNSPEAFICEIFTAPVQEVDPATQQTVTVTSINYQNTSNGWELTSSQGFNANVAMQGSDTTDYVAEENLD